ncbi:DNA-binding domain-containing protein [Clostridium rectalis]|uniref:DNA-binding domain-containing protein n=1 Tax=Clostridium rectalis TaxID=2040295 RepID=UPI000F631C70|nr:DNA-binding domain-containing protein [Clostridium rectalis]
MLRIFIAENDLKTIGNLERVILDRGLGIVIGHTRDGVEALKKIDELNPDLILVNYHVYSIDGISVIKQVKKKYSNIHCITISDEKSKIIVEQAYRSGAEFCINKPISSVEIENIIEKIVELSKLNDKLNQISRIINKDNILSSNRSINNSEEKVKHIMQDIGIYGDTGSEEIIQIVKHLIDTNKNMANYTIKEICGYFTSNPKWMEQRIRRLALSGMSNLANLGIEDYLNDTFVEYSNSIYNFEQVKKEMDYVRGKSRDRGRINLKKFIAGLVFYCEK